MKTANSLTILMWLSQSTLANIFPGEERSNQEEYNDFLAMIEHQNKLDEERAEKYVYRPDPNYLDLSRYNQDRHGQYFTKCVDYNSSAESAVPMNIRCPMKSSRDYPACHLTHDFTNGITYQGCWDSPRFDKETCKDECILDVTNRRGQDSVDKFALVGFCCCLTESCNANAKETIARGLEKYHAANPSMSRHHHKHHNKETTMSFWDRLRIF